MNMYIHLLIYQVNIPIYISEAAGDRQSGNTTIGSTRQLLQEDSVETRKAKAARLRSGSRSPGDKVK